MTQHHERYLTTYPIGIIMKHVLLYVLVVPPFSFVVVNGD